MAIAGRRRAALSVFGGALIAVAAFVSGAWLFAPKVPQELSPAEPTMWSPVTPRTVDDPRQVDLAVAMAAPVEIRSASEGMVTSIDCSPPAGLVSGTVALSVDGDPVIGLNTGTPLWRDLGRGDSGADVSALQAELVRLGYDADLDGIVGRQTLNAVAALLQLTDDEAAVYDVIDRASFLWLPTAEVSSATCDSAVGERAAPGDVLFTAPGVILSARIELLPAAMVEGPRMLVVDDQVLSVDSEGSITDPTALRGLQSTRSFARWESDPFTSPPIQGSLILAEPRTVFSVAPLAIYDVVDRSGCVSVGDQGLLVSIISSEFGHSLIEFEEGATPASEVEISENGGPPCR